MSGLTLEAYMRLRGVTSAQLAIEIGSSRQNIDNWKKEGATVEMAGGHNLKNIKITREVFPRVVHETQVRK